MNRLRWIALVLFVGILAVLPSGHAQEQTGPEHSTPDGQACEHPMLDHPVPEAHACNCHRECYKDEAGNQHTKEDPQCRWFCKPDHCACGMEPCDTETQ
jgi:hypothetical protein